LAEGAAGTAPTTGAAAAVATAAGPGGGARTRAASCSTSKGPSPAKKTHSYTFCFRERYENSHLGHRREAELLLGLRPGDAGGRVGGRRVVAGDPLESGGRARPAVVHSVRVPEQRHAQPVLAVACAFAVVAVVAQVQLLLHYHHRRRLLHVQRSDLPKMNRKFALGGMYAKKLCLCTFRKIKY
jgi:hypothetical protein